MGKMRISDRLRSYALSLGVFLSTPQVVLAQDEAPSAPDWVQSYFLVFLCVGLGLLVICRPGKRGKEVKP